MMIDEQQESLPTDATLWGGWQDIFNEYSAKLEAAGAEITYVKEKYGFMRFEADYNDNAREIQRLIHEAEEKSLNTCQECGKEGTQVDVGSWIYTLCEDCHIVQKQKLPPERRKDSTSEDND